MTDVVPAVSSSAPGRRERNKREKLTRLVRAARRLFAQKGFDAATALEIAQAADIGTGTLYLYAPSKEDLLILVSREELEALFDQAFEARRPGAPLIDRLADFFDVLIDYHDADRGLARALMKQLAVMRSEQGRRDVRHINRTFSDRLRELVAEAQAASEIRPDAPVDILVGNLVSIYRMQLQSWLNEFLTKDEFRARLRASVDLQLLACRRTDPGRETWQHAPERSSSAG
jgi:AcrR family transcriptional regulator